MKCINCKKEYKEFTLYNFNLGLCEDCLKKFEKDKKIERDGTCDIVKHKITCPKCKKVYDDLIVDEKCRTEDCNVWFFWDDLDHRVFARWVKG